MKEPCLSPMTPSPGQDNTFSNITQLIANLESFASRLSEQNDLVIHQHIDEFFYMQKCEELKFLLEEYRVAGERLAQVTRWLDEKYHFTISRWKDDLHQLHQIEQQRIKG